MNITINIDWKFVVAVGVATMGTIFAVKMDSSSAERVSIKMIDAYEVLAIAGNSNC